MISAQPLSIHWPAFLAFAWFAWIGSVTPGPNCMMALTTGTHFGVRAAIPHALGVMLGFSLMLLAAGLGVAGLIAAHPLVSIVLRWLGIGYLVWLGWQLLRSAGADEKLISRAPRIHESALLQLANPKAWMLITATVSAYQSIARPASLQLALVIATFALSCSLSIFIWAWMGQRIRPWLENATRMKIFNGLAGLSLILTALWTALTVR